LSDKTVNDAKRQSQFHRALHDLKGWIVDGKVTPNQHLTEADLAKSLAVSRTTVRSVLLDLDKDGFITLELNRGARVRSFTPEEAREILIARERIEGIAAALAAENRTSQQVLELEEILRSMTSAQAAQKPEEYSERSGRFHAIIVEAACNRTIARFIEQTRYQLVVRQFWNREIVHPRPESLSEHSAILVAIRAGESYAAESMMRLHVSNARDVLNFDVAEATPAGTDT